MIESVYVKGFRSLADVKIDGLPQLTVLIGPNGSGKSNFMRFFEMLSWMMRSQRLALFVGLRGGADDQLHGGHRITPRLEAQIGMRTSAGRNDYRFSLEWGESNQFIFAEEKFRFSQTGSVVEASWQSLGCGHSEARIVEAAQSRNFQNGRRDIDSETARVIVDQLKSCSTYQFHDTSARLKTTWDREDAYFLRSDAGNLAAILLRLEQEDAHRYRMICRHIGRILPGFSHFRIEEAYGKVHLYWTSKDMDKTVGPHLTSDGSLRFFALVTLLHLPPELLPDVILLDEPELGLHPRAVNLLGGMLRVLATEKQVVIATQSPLLVNAFGLDEIVVCDLQDGATQCRRLDPEEHRFWLDKSFTPGELWQQNFLGGQP